MSYSSTGFAANPLAERLQNIFWEMRLGISTRGIADVQHDDSYHYATMYYSTINRILKFLDLKSSDVFVDIGSGKGRVLCCAARYPVKKVVGVDLSREFCDEARRNAAQMRGRKAPIEVHNILAQQLDYCEATVFLLFNPFGATTLDEVLMKIRSDVKGRGNGLRIAYANPAHDEVFADHTWLEPLARWDRSKNSIEHSVSFYRTDTV